MRDKTLTINKHIAWRYADNTVYILEPHREEVHVLNETGSFIWRLIEKKKTRSQILTALVRQYSVDTKKASKDISEFIERYVREGFLK